MTQQVLRQAMTGSGALHGATLLTFADCLSRGWSAAAFGRANGLLLRIVPTLSPVLMSISVIDLGYRRAGAVNDPQPLSLDGGRDWPKSRYPRADKT
jgi:hypothetical protein